MERAVPGFLIACLCALLASPAFARPVRTPAGAEKLCSDYPWACAATKTGTAEGTRIFGLARSVNDQVNRSIRQRTDQAQYGVAEKWVLPKSSGDCEDLALLKMRKLIDSGVAPANLRLAQVMKRNVPSHVVLLVRTAGGEEYVLDSLSSNISRRSDSDYVFLKQQNRSIPAQWEAGL